MSTPAQTLLARRGLGVNVERLNLVKMGFNNTPARWATLYGNGVRFARGFVAYRPSVNMGLPGWPGTPSAATLAPYLDAVALANVAGIVTFLDLLDVIDAGSEVTGANLAAIVSYIGMAGGEIAKRNFDPKMASFGVCNEWAAGTNSSWRPVQTLFHAALRAKLPGTVLTVNAAYWGDVSEYSNAADPFKLPPGEDGSMVILQVHDYNASGGNAAYWTALAAKMDALGFAWHLGEVGYVDPSFIAAVAKGAPNSAPCFWAITDGTMDRMNVSSSDPTLQPAIIAAIQAGTAAMATTQPAPVPAATPSVITVSPPGTVAPGAVNMLDIRTVPPLAAIEIVAVGGNSPWPFYDTSYYTVGLTAGLGSFPVTWRATGDFVKYGPVGGPYVDGPPVTVSAAAAGVTAAQIAAVQADVDAAGASNDAASAGLAALKPAS